MTRARRKERNNVFDGGSGDQTIDGLRGIDSTVEGGKERKGKAVDERTKRMIKTPLPFILLGRGEEEKEEKKNDQTVDGPKEDSRDSRERKGRGTRPRKIKKGQS